ncbi:MAG: hypothetical protein HY454_02195 [Parcubacteria group bacterium]|nr:hypothetical protein [Parcubacteria group bacterium]
MTKLISLATVFCLSISGLSAAQEQPLLTSKPLPIIAALLSDVKPSVEINPPQKKEQEKFLLAIDVPLALWEYSASLNGVESRPFGESIQSERRNIGFPYALWPRISFYSKNAHLDFRGGASTVWDGGKIRKNTEVNLLIEGSVWLVLVGVEGFKFDEDVPFVLAGDGYRIDFNRQAYGGDAWIGAKLGSFHGSFIAVRFGKGLVESQGKEEYVSSVLNDSIFIPLYSQRFSLDRQSVEGRVLTRYFAPAFKFESNKYEKQARSEGDFVLKDNSFDDSMLRLEIELIPPPKRNPVRIVVQRTYYYGRWNRLLFKNYQSDWQVYLRFAFK